VDRLTIPRPDDWHLHLRDGAMLAGVVGDTAAHFGRAIIMPNLVPPVVTSADAEAYRNRINAALADGADFQPLMTLYLTEATDPADVIAGAASGVVTAVKLYPAGATTNSSSGVRDFDKVIPVLEAMAEHGVPLCVHGEVTDPAVDIFDREAVFLETVLDPLRRRVPGLRVVLEHVTTADGVDYVRGGGEISRRQSLRITSSSTGTIFWPGESVRITIVCRLPSVNITVRRWLRQRFRARAVFFWALTVPRMWMRQRKRGAAVPAFIQRPTRCPALPRFLRRSRRCRHWKHLPHAMGRDFTDFP